MEKTESRFFFSCVDLKLPELDQDLNRRSKVDLSPTLPFYVSSVGSSSRVDNPEYLCASVSTPSLGSSPWCCSLSLWWVTTESHYCPLWQKSHIRSHRPHPHQEKQPSRKVEPEHNVSLHQAIHYRSEWKLNSENDDLLLLASRTVSELICQRAL